VQEDPEVGVAAAELVREGHVGIARVWGGRATGSQRVGSLPSQASAAEAMPVAPTRSPATSPCGAAGPGLTANPHRDRAAPRRAMRPRGAPSLRCPASRESSTALDKPSDTVGPSPNLGDPPDDREAGRAEPVPRSCVDPREEARRM
jgi:hypothetical protein